MKAKLALVVLLIAARPSLAHPVSLPVMIDKLNDAAKACGISESQLENVALRTLEDNRLQPDSDSGGWLHVRATIHPAPRNLCAAHISVQMKASPKPVPSNGVANLNERFRVPNVVLCDEGGDYAAPKVTLSSEIESAVEQSIKQCLASLKY